MSTASTQSRGINRRINSLQGNGRGTRNGGRIRHRHVSDSEAYNFALRVAYLNHLLQPRTRRLQHVAAPQPQVHRAQTSMTDLMKDFTIVRDSKSTRFPHGFMAELERALTAVLMGKQPRQEYNDPVVKRTFAVFYTAFTEQSFRKRMEKDRKVEDLVLIFFSSATKELQKGKILGEDSWKLMVDRHLALFVRLISVTLKLHDWMRDRPELTSRLATLEQKLLAHDQDLAADSQRAGGAGGQTVEVEVPLSNEVKDMPLVLIVGRVFGIPIPQMQADINQSRSSWTERAALQDLKTYQNFLNLNSKRTLRPDDFDTIEAYESWRRSEGPDLSQMMLAIMQYNPQLAKSTPVGSLPHVSVSQTGSALDASHSEISHNLSEDSDNASCVIDQPLDVAALRLSENGSEISDDSANPFVFIPSDPKAYYRAVLKHALTHDIQDQTSTEGVAEEGRTIKLLSKQSVDLLTEIAARWRVPMSTRLVLFLDVIREKFLEQEITLDLLDAAFIFAKEPQSELKKPALNAERLSVPLYDRSKWTIVDFALNTQILSALHEALLRDLYDQFMHCYNTKAPVIGPLMLVLEEHIYADPLFSRTPEEAEKFNEQLAYGLQQKAKEMYELVLGKEIPTTEDEWQFYHVIQLGRSVVRLLERIQKRYRKNPEIMGTNPLIILLEVMLPSYGADSRDLIQRIMNAAQMRNEDVAISDGFELYRELVEVRRIHMESLPDEPFAFKIEDLLADFVWRWLRLTEEKIAGWVEEAVKQDEFTVRTDSQEEVPTEGQRHSVSVIDIFRSFNQSIDQLFDLHWDDDYQHAKFMTSLSKSIGEGLVLYSELVEKQFRREMDRLTPEQEAAANRTRQERWVQLAKDAWTNKEKIEPFQFFPESFVKLNNIEWALKQLDDLQQSINVDTLAKLIEENTPPADRRVRKVSNFVFTVKVVEAEDLKACDINGLSDPYVVLGDEYQRRLGKTRIIYANLNPRWEESFDVTTQGPLNLIATVWDWDALGEHDCVGRCSIKLDPSHFNDFMPREYWLDLDTQGRLLVRVSMEGEKDDIQFYFGKTFRGMRRTGRDMTRMITDKLSAYIHHCLSHSALRSLLNRGTLSIQSVSSLFRAAQRQPPMPTPAPTAVDITNALTPLFTYFDDNFAIMNQTLTSSAMLLVMTRLWKEVLTTIESLLVPPLSDKASQQRQLSQQELDIVFKWLQLLYDFFHAVDEQTGECAGVSGEVLKSPKYHDLQSLHFFYFDATMNLITTSERMASATAVRQQQQARNRLSAPGALGSPTMGKPGQHSFGGAASLLGMQSTRRSKSIMLSRNLGTIREAKAEKRKESQAEPNDDMILRILRMRPEAAKYLKDRSRQKERLAASAAAEMIVRQSVSAGSGGRMIGILPRR